MNSVQQFWNDFCVANHKEGVKYKDAFQFGVSADWLADLVVKGKKIATTSGYVFYELEKKLFPKLVSILLFWMVGKSQLQSFKLNQLKLFQ